MDKSSFNAKFPPLAGFQDAKVSDDTLVSTGKPTENVKKHLPDRRKMDRSKPTRNISQEAKTTNTDATAY